MKELLYINNLVEYIDNQDTEITGTYFTDAENNIYNKCIFKLLNFIIIEITFNWSSFI